MNCRKVLLKERLVVIQDDATADTSVLKKKPKRNSQFIS
jgi:hypothetical protein